MNEKTDQIKEMTEPEQIEEIKLIIAENMATYSKAKMPYEEALKFCALGIIASGYRKESETADEVMNLTAENEVLKRDVQNLERTLEERNEMIEDLKADKKLIFTEFEKVKNKIDEYEAGKAVILTADRYAELERIERNGIISVYLLREAVRKETAKDILKILNGIGGCDSTDEYFKGWDAAIDGAYKAIKEKFGVEVEE